jgi:large subunit ribosomal protein L11
MAEKKIVETLVDGGKATAGPPLGPVLGPLGVNVLAIVNEINSVTKDYSGMKVPVTISINLDDKSFEVSVGIPTTAALIVKELGVEKGSGTPNTEKVGNLTFEQVIKIFKIKKDVSLSVNLKTGTKEIIGTCLSMGVTIDDKDAKEILSQIDQGEYDSILFS